MMDVITIGSATLDVVVRSDALQPQKKGEASVLELELGDKMDVEHFLMVSGGGATNVAVGCQRLGLQTAVVSEIGKDFPAQIILNEMQQDGVDTSFVVSERSEETAVSLLLVASDGSRTILTHRGAAYELESRDLPWEHLYDTRWIHLGSIGGDKQLIVDLFEYLRLYDIGLSWTPSQKDMELLAKQTILPESIRADVFILNSDEWEELETLHAQLLQQISIVVVTDGRAGGTVFVEGQKAFDYVSDKVETVEETGAGDAFAAGFISAMVHGKSLQDCVKWGKRNAANVVQHIGAKQGLLTSSEIEK